MTLTEQLEGLKSQIADHEKLRLRREADRDKAKEALASTEAKIRDEFGVEPDEAQALLDKMESDLHDKLSGIAKSLKE